VNRPDEGRPASVEDSMRCVDGPARGLTLALALSFSSALLAGAGDLDPGFGAGGMVTRELAGRAIQALRTLPGGAVLVAGSAEKAGARIGFVARMRPDGVLDGTFGTGGIVTLDTLESAPALAVQPDGRILAGGSSTRGIRLVRLDARGVVDRTFGSEGCATLELAGAGTPEDLRTLLVLPSGRLLVLARATGTYGDSFATVAALARLDAGGRLDRTFGSGGRVFVSFGKPSLFDGPVGAALLADGRIVVVGSAAAPRAGLKEIALVRLQADGSVDATFGKRGVTRASFGGASSTPSGVAVLAGGKLLVAGRSGPESAGESSRAGLVRLEADGSVDASFGSGGRAEASVPAKDLDVRGVAVRRDGRIFVLSRARTKKEPGQPVVAAFSASGAADSAFGAGGWARIGGQDGSPNALAFDEDSRLLVAGSTEKESFVARLDAGPLDCSASSPSARVSGAVAICPGGSAEIRADLTGTPPWDLTWSDGFRQRDVTASPALRKVEPAATTGYAVTFVGDAAACGTAAGKAVVTVAPPLAPAVAAPARVTAGAAGLTASVAERAGASYAWKITNGTITAGQGTSRVTFQAPEPGTLKLQAVVTTAEKCVTPAGEAPVTVGARGELFLSRGRVRATLRYKNPYNGTTGEAVAIPHGDEFGLFHFGDPANPEVVVKLLDAGPSKPYLLSHAGVTDFEYTVTFTEFATGQTFRFTKPAGTYQAGADASSLVRGPDEAPEVYAAETKPAAGGAGSVDLSKGRVRVSVTYRSSGGKEKTATALPQQDGYALFHFGDPKSPEVLVKVLDFGEGRPFLAFHAGLTDLEYAVTYTVVKTGKTLTLKKPAGSYGGGSDSSALVP
jgi:uncharacterized delta-60 repeat protein